MKGIFALVMGILLPLSVQAAGFADQSIFLSKDPVVEGDTVLVHVVVSNPSTSPFVGSLKIADEASTIGTLPVELSAGGADTFSVSWKPIAGTHKITATLVLQSGSLAATQEASFSIAAKPAPQPATATKTSGKAFPAVEPSTPVYNALVDVAPGFASSSVPLFSSIDGDRALAAQKLYDGVVWARKELASSQTTKPATSTSGVTQVGNNILHTLWILAVTAALYICSVLRSVVTSVGLFYPIIAFLILYLFWRGYKAVRKPSY